jgi:PAS domain-containing protein
MFKQESFSILRKEAEAKLATVHPQKAEIEHDLQTWLITKHADEVIRELQVRQIELELQNEQLRQTQILLEESRDRYFDLYEFAPNGYFTLTIEGVICNCNFIGAELFGIKDRATLLNRRFAWFITSDDLERWNLYFLRLKQSEKQGEEKQTQSIELNIKQVDETIFSARLDARFDTQQLLRVAVSKITPEGTFYDEHEQTTLLRLN